jgi:hypothetical protein
MKTKILVVDDEVRILKSMIFRNTEDKIQGYFAKDETECSEILKSKSNQIDWILGA